MNNLKNEFTQFVEGLENGDLKPRNYDDEILGKFLNSSYESLNEIENVELREEKLKRISSDLRRFLERFGDYLYLDAESQGGLSQLIESVQAAVAGIGDIKNLPPQGTTIQTATVDLMETSISRVLEVQERGSTFINSNEPILSSIAQELEGEETPISEIRSKMHSVSDAALDFQKSLISLDLNEIRSSLASYSSESLTLKQQYESEKVSLAALIEDTKKRLAEAENNRWYYLTLGILGLPGLAAAAIVIATISGDLENLQNQITALEAQLNTSIQLEASVSSLTVSFGSLIEQIGFLQNQIEFLIGECNTVTLNLDKDDVDRKATRLYVLATVESMKELKTDLA